MDQHEQNMVQNLLKSISKAASLAGLNEFLIIGGNAVIAHQKLVDEIAARRNNS